MESRPKRSSIIEKDYRERKRQRRTSSGAEKSSSPVVGAPNEEHLSYSKLEKLYKEILDLKDPEDDEYELSALFMELPSREEYPDYYQIIRHPIALEDMKAKIDEKEYQYMSQFKSDIDLMVSNAKKYNMKESQVYEDAVKIQKFVKSWNEPKEKAIVKLPAEAFAHPPATKIKTIKLRAVDKPKQKSVNLKALMESISKRETKRSMELLEEDPNLDPNELVAVEMFNDKFTWSPLHAASYYGDVKLVEALILRGGNVEINDTWYSATPLGWAAFGDKDKVVRLLVQKYHANTKSENVHGQVPFDVVSDQDDPRWVGLLKPGTFVQPPKPTTPQLPVQLKLQQEQLQQKQQQQQHLQQQQLRQQQMLFQQQQQQLQQQRPNNGMPPPNQQNQQIKGAPPAGFQAQMYQPTADGQMRKRRGRPPKSETDAAAVRPTKEIDINTFDPVAFEIELFNAIRTHTDNSSRLYSELFEDLPDRAEYPEYFKVTKNPRSLTEIAEKMQTRAYPNLHSWMNDMKLVFENALNFNEPGSRIFRDAKLLMRLLLRLKERILARLEVPVSQEDAIFRLNLSNRPFDVDALSEDKRKIKRLLTTTNKSRTQSMEPEHHHHNQQIPMPNPYLIQQQQHQQQQSLQQQQAQAQAQVQAQQQQMMLQQQMLLQQQQQQQQQMQMQQQMQQQQMLQQQQMALPPQPSPSGIPPQPPLMMMQQPLYDMNTFASGRSPSNLSPFSDPNGQSPRSPLAKASKEFYALLRNGGSFLNGMTLSSLNHSDQFNMSIDGEYLGHSIVVPSQIETLVIQPDFPKELKAEENRLSITILQNNIRLNTSNAKDEWTTVPLSKGTNSIKINITANVTQPESTVPEYKSQVYHLFVTQTW